MKKFILFFTLLGISTPQVSCAEKTTVKPMVTNTPATTHVEKSEINWVKIEDVPKLRESGNNKPLYINMYTDWCQYCKMMEAGTMKDKEVISFMNENFIPVLFHAETQPDFTLNGKEFKLEKINTAKSKSINVFVPYVLGEKIAYPAGAIWSKDGALITVVPGYYDAKTLMTGLTKLKTDMPQLFNQ